VFISCVRVSLSLFCILLSTLSLAQSQDWILGQWSAQVGSEMYEMKFFADGNYSFSQPNANYLEQGTWQLVENQLTQVWVDPGTSENQQQTYQLEQLSDTSFKMSGGNLGSTVFTFRAVSSVAQPVPNLLAEPPASTPATVPAPQAGTAQTPQVQQPPPEAGTYKCAFTENTFVQLYNPLSGMLEMKPSLNFYPSPFGTLTLDGNGAYTLDGDPSFDETGSYTFDPATNGLSFSGAVIALLNVFYAVQDGTFTVYLEIPDGGGSHHCEHASANAKTPTTTTPNPGLPGTMTVAIGGGAYSATAGTIFSFGIEAGTETGSHFEGEQPYRAANGETVYIQRNDSMSEFDIVIAGVDGKTAVKFENVNITDGGEETYFIYPEPDLPILSADGSLIVYGSQLPGAARVLVKDRTGNLVTTLLGFTEPNWTPDGRLLLAGNPEQGGEAGIYITDATLANPTRVDPNIGEGNMPAMSPDGKLIAFVYTGQLWTMNAFGSDAQVVAAEGELIGWPEFSPDSQWLAVVTNYDTLNNAGEIYVVPVNGNTAQPQYLSQPDLSAIEIGDYRSRISWR
jgi:WD40-like Beta Propeller Repeat